METKPVKSIPKDFSDSNPVKEDKTSSGPVKSIPKDFSDPVRVISRTSLVQSNRFLKIFLTPIQSKFRPPINNIQMESVSPFPISQGWYHFMWVQISGHFSVQSSSTFGSRKAHKPIYILGSKKIEQGQLLYPKICPPIFFKVLTSIISIYSSLLKGCTVQTILLSQSKLGFWFLQGSWGFQGLNQVPYIHIHCQASTCQVSRLTRSSCTVKKP